MAAEGWPDEVKRVDYPSSGDGSMQPALVYGAEGDGARPLLVALHTWSGDFKQGGGQAVFARWCIQEGWHLVHPDFRGPNRTPESLGSELAVQDIVDAVAYMRENHAVDGERIYLVGVSGGGHMALLMAGRHPEIWAGVSAWCGISDVRAWWRQCAEGGLKYARDIELACGGKPEGEGKAKKEAERRSPLSYLGAAAGVNLDISHGVDDGRSGSVPFSHSLYAFDEVVGKGSEEALGAGWIEAFYATRKVPEGGGEWEDALYGKRRPLFRRSAERVRVTIFDGGHEIVHGAALNWLAVQRKGKPAVWEVGEPVEIRAGVGEGESGK